MLNDDQGKSTPIAHRKPRLSAPINRRKIAKPVRDTMMLKKSGNVVVCRPQPKKIEATKADTFAQQKKATNPQAVATRPTAKQLKETAIEKALAAAAKKGPKEETKKPSIQFGFKRILLALACATAAVFAIVYFVNLNAPDISLKVAAMQSGIEASYPSYVPRDFKLSDITSEDGKITLNFKNSSNGDNFSLIEEKSSWDSNTLLNNYVRENFDGDFTTMREQGLTIYINDEDAAWVNGGVVYKLHINSGSLTKKQVRSIAVSL